MRWRLPSKPRCRFPKLVSDRVRRSLTCLVPQSGPSPTMGAPWRTSQMQHCGTTRASDAPFAARPNRMVRFQASIPMAMADAVPSEEFAPIPAAVVFRMGHAGF